MILTLVALLAAAAICVPMSHRAGFGAVLGYLVAGVAIGPRALGLVSDVDQVRGIAELGVVMLLFLIGLEVRPQRLWVMRRAVFGLGTLQVATTAAVLALAARATGQPWPTCVVLGFGFALSSTAIVLPMLAERDLLNGRSGRDVFGVLLFQDLAFIPLVALVPLLSGFAEARDVADLVPHAVPWLDVGRALGAVAAILLGGRVLLPRAFRLIGGARNGEVFITMALLTVVGAAALANAAGLSMSLGAFMAGVLLSESDYRHELQADIEPFEGILLGFFFMAVGMQADLRLAAAHPLALAGGVAALFVVKIAVALGIGRRAGQPWAAAVRFALALPQASEFSFVLFGAAVATGAMTEDHSAFAILVVAASMAATPLVFAASERLLIPRLKIAAPPPAYDAITGDAPIIIAGFGRVGTIIGRLLSSSDVPFVALDRDSAQVEVVRRFGGQVFYGDPARPDVLRAAGAARAKLLIVAVEDKEYSIALVDMVRRTFPDLKILAEARDRNHAYLLMDRDVDYFVRETFHAALRMSEIALREAGMSKADASRTVDLFCEWDERMLVEQHAIYHDEQRLIQSVQEARTEFASLMEADRQRATQDAAE